MFEDDDSANTSFGLLCSIFAHALLPIVVWADFLTNKLSFKPSHLNVVIIVSVVYTGVNYGTTKLRGIPVYPIMPWNDADTLIFVAANFVAMSVFFWLGGMLKDIKKLETIDAKIKE